MQRNLLWLTGLLFLAAALGADAVLAQRGAALLSGTVVDAASGAPIAGATIALSPSGKRARSDSSGQYRIANLAAGTYTVTCSAPGYETRRTAGFELPGTGAVAFECRLSVRAAKEEKAKDEPAAKGDSGSMRGGLKSSMVGSAGLGVAGGTGDARTATRRRAPAPVQIVAPSPRPIMVQPEHNTEAYAVRDENPFTSPRTQPLSTFSIDVDTASYSNLRRFIERQSQVPPRDAIKLEELVNYFTYDYPEPTGQHPVAVHTEVSTAPWKSAHKLVRIGVQARKIETHKLPPSNLVFLIDVSGSMNRPDRLPLLKSSFSLLVNELRPKDRVAIVVYAGAAGLVLPSTPGTDKDRILQALDRLQAGGSTAGAAGIQLAYQVARDNYIRGGNNRVILATDGDFNVGPSSDAELVRIIEGKRKEGVFLTVLGYGMGNYKDSKLEQLAAKGNGNHAYIDTLMEARKVLVTELGATLFTIAKDVKLQVEFNPARVKAYRLLGYENRMLAAQDFNDDKKDAGDMGTGHSVTAFYEIIPAGSAEPVPGVDELKYQAAAPTGAAASDELMTVKLRYKQPDGDASRLLSHVVADRVVPLARTSADFRFAAAVAELGLLLRASEHRGGASFAGLIGRAEGALGDDRHGYRRAFLELARRAEALSPRR